MISLQQLKSTCENTKFKKLKLPSSDKYTQPTYFEYKLNFCKLLEAELKASSINEVNNELTTDIIKQKLDIINNGNNVIDNLQSTFGNQFEMSSNTNTLAPELQNNTPSMNANVSYENILSYSENEKIRLFGTLYKLFDKHNILSNNNITINDCYFYGFKNPDSFIKCVLLLNNPSFIIKNKYEIQNIISSYKNEFSMKFETTFKDGYYNLISELKDTYKVARRNFIRKPNYISSSILQCYSDTNNKSILLFHLDNDDLSFSIYLPNIISNKTTLDTLSLSDITFDTVLLESKSVYTPLIIPKTNNKLEHVFKPCLDTIEFRNKTMYTLDFNSIKEHTLKYTTTLTTPNISSNLQRILDTPTRFLVENNEGRLHKLRMQKKKELYKYEEMTDFSELNKSSDSDTEPTNTTVASNDADTITPTVASNDTDTNTSTNTNTNTVTKLVDEVLKAITSYKLQDLQNLMTKYGLDIKKQAVNGKMINKTKKECYDALIANS